MKYQTTPPPPRDRREMMLGATRLAEELLWAKLSGFLSAELDRLDDALAEDDNLGHPTMLKVRDDLIAWIAMTREAAKIKPPNDKVSDCGPLTPPIT